MRHIAQQMISDDVMAWWLAGAKAVGITIVSDSLIATPKQILAFDDWLRANPFVPWIKERRKL